MFGISVREGRVHIEMGRARREVACAPEQAKQAAHHIEQALKSIEAMKLEPPPTKGITLEMSVRSYGGKVYITLKEAMERVAMPADIARQVAALLRSKATMAMYDMEYLIAKHKQPVVH